MGEMVERVAAALYSDDPEDWDDGIRIVNGTFGGEGYMQRHPETQARYKQDMNDAREKARRAIEAMREPTNEMHKKMCDCYNSPACIWMTGINTALSEK